MISRAFDTAFETMLNRNWDRIYVFVDIHSTVIKPNYDKDNIPTEFYRYGKQVLQYLSSRDDIVLIMYTCSHQKEIDEYLKLFKSNDINFKYINVNPEVKTDLNGYGCYDTKPYMNVMIDDKAGFLGEEDWLPLVKYFNISEGVNKVNGQNYKITITKGNGKVITLTHLFINDPTHSEVLEIILEDQINFNPNLDNYSFTLI